jgi:hypothetical protein
MPPILKEFHEPPQLRPRPPGVEAAVVCLGGAPVLDAVPPEQHILGAPQRRPINYDLRPTIRPPGQSSLPLGPMSLPERTLRAWGRS